MGKLRFLEVGVFGVVPAVVIGLVTHSWDYFALACLATGVLIEVVATMSIHGESQPRTPEQNLMLMKGNQYGYVAAVEVPTDAKSWRPTLLGVPALCIGVIAVVLIASLR